VLEVEGVRQTQRLALVALVEAVQVRLTHLPQLLELLIPAAVVVVTGGKFKGEVAALAS
jgi:hypothetical protein